jgi:hypothetical protein
VGLAGSHGAASFFPQTHGAAAVASKPTTIFSSFFLLFSSFFLSLSSYFFFFLIK